MKKYLYALIAALCLTACSSADEPEATPDITAEVRELWSALSGTFAADFYFDASSDNVWYTETISFHPYDKPRQLSATETLATGIVFAYGEADIDDTRFTSISGTSRCFYSIDRTIRNSVMYYTVTFHKYADDNGASLGRPDERHVKLLFSGDIVMWPYGTTESENKHTYKKQ